MTMDRHQTLLRTNKTAASSLSILYPWRTEDLPSPLVLDRVSSPITKRVYNMALNEFMTW